MIISDQYRILEKLGQGSFGTVSKALDIKGGDLVAIKSCFSNDKNGIPYTTLREVSILKQLQGHCNVVDFKSVFFDEKNSGGIHLVFQYYPTNLGEYIKTWTVAIPRDVVLKLISQIFDGLAFCHKQGIIHRDIKPYNVLLTSNMNVCIADFGMARSMETGLFTKRVCTLWYCAPETLLDCNNYTEKIDIWSCGCILAELFQRKPLFRGRDLGDQLEKIVQTMGYPDLSKWDEFKNFSLQPRWLSSTEEHMEENVDLSKIFSSTESHITNADVTFLKDLLQYSASKRLGAQQAFERVKLLREN